MKDDEMRSIIIGIAAVFFLVFYSAGFFVLWLGVDATRLGWDARTWPTVDARLHECAVVSSHTQKGGVVYRAKVKYSYALNGKHYSGSKLEFDDWSSGGEGRHAENCRKVFDMAPFVIRYDPEQPHISTIFPSEGLGLSLSMYFAIAWLSAVTFFFTKMILRAPNKTLRARRSVADSTLVRQDAATLQ